VKEISAGEKDRLFDLRSVDGKTVWSASLQRIKVWDAQTTFPTVIKEIHQPSFVLEIVNETMWSGGDGEITVIDLVWSFFVLCMLFDSCFYFFMFFF
jgi:hypothetical protein